MSIGARVPPASPSRTSVVFLSCMRPCLSKAQLYVVGVDSSAEAREPSTPFALNCASLDFVASASAPAPRPRSIAEMPVEEEEAEDVAFVKYFRSLEHSRALRTRLHETLRKGWFDLARARFHSGRFSQIGSDMILAKELEPSFTLERIGPEPDSGWRVRDVDDDRSVLNDSTPSINNLNTLRSRIKNTTDDSVVKRGESGKATAKHEYFGGRSSKALADTRNEFFKAVQLLCEMANIDLQMRSFASSISQFESDSEHSVSENEKDEE